MKIVAILGFLALAVELVTFVSTNAFLFLYAIAPQLPRAIASVGLLLVFISLIGSRMTKTKTVFVVLLSILAAIEGIECFLPGAAVPSPVSILDLASAVLSGLMLIVAPIILEITGIVFLAQSKRMGTWAIILGMGFIAVGLGDAVLLMPFDWSANYPLKLLATEIRIVLAFAVVSYLVAEPRPKQQTPKP